MTKTHIFISYARSDAADVAAWLQRRLENYRIPKRLVGAGVPVPASGRLRKVFVDTEDLSVSNLSFREQLRQELSDAEFLIVLCSKGSSRPDSFVHREISYFREKNGGDTTRILPIALDGVSKDAIPEELWNVVENRNIVIWDREWAMDGGNGKAHQRSAFFKVLEFLLGVDAGVLNNRYWMEWRRRIWLWTAVGLSFMTSLVGVMAHDIVNQTHRVKFEKKVFPLSIDYSYMEAFAAPLFIMEPDKHNIVIAAMPKDYSELGNKPGMKKEAISRDLAELGWTYERRQYSRPNWSRPLETAVTTPGGMDITGTNVFVDVVSQLSAVKKVLDYLTNDNPFHSVEDRESLAQYYIEEFKTALLELLANNTALENCSWEFKFVTDKQELKQALDSIFPKTNQQ